ncbi:MAG: SusC/RagA family TonB-linked outer membrane protein [Bacteroidota bacterium]|nr:SusC/RagA family TonB-linked outer membrane protein [Candidatus Kapabacteria bacterium]MDW8220336.1 SusC/RagA family TonB-linked outer membrane protein [Bacteroidota bacterium]
MKRIVLGSLMLLLVLLASTRVFAQKTVTGRVTSSDDAAPLRSVKVVAKGTKVGTFTDVRGQYKITLPEGATTLVFSSVGYATREVVVGDRTVVDVRLDFDAKALDDVVVTAFGVKQEKKALGYAVQELSAQEIMQNNQPNIVAALQGRLAGVTINNSGGGVGAGSQIIIRGASSLSPSGNNQPLFVIDGIPISNETRAGNNQPSQGAGTIGGSAEAFAMSNRAADINPDDIESINILKGPAATALYGLRAANGVVIITTKKGISGKTLVTFNSTVTIDEVGKTPRVQNIYGEGGFADTSASTTVFWSFGLPRSLKPEPFYDNYRNFFRVGVRYDQQLSISGGTENAKFFTSISRMDQTGIVPGTNFQRTTISLRGSAKYDDQFDMSGSVNYSNSGGARPQNGGRSIFSALSFWIPSFDVNDITFQADGVTRTTDGRQTNFNYSRGIIENPLYVALNAPLRDNVNRVFGDVKFNYHPFSWLTATYQVTLDYFNDARRRVVGPEIEGAAAVGGYITEESYNNREINSQLFITAAHNIDDDISLSLTLGNAITDIENSGIFSRGEGFAVTGFYDLSNTTTLFTGREYSVQRLIGVFADAKVSYKNMLFVNITGRNDWSSTLPAQNRSFFYPSASVSFVFSELLKDASDWLSLGKVRASYAAVGRDGIGPYRIGEYYSLASGFPIGNVTGFRLSGQAGSTNLRPERMTGIEVGAEMRFLDNRFGIDVAYFNQTTEDQIVNLPVSNATGFSAFVINGGTVRNTGIEVLLNARIIQTNEFSWEATVNWSRIRGEIVDIAPGINEIVPSGGSFEPYASLRWVRPGTDPSNPNPAIGDIYGYDFIRNANGQAIIGPDGFPTVDLTRPVKVGNAFPDWQGGLTNTFSWNGLSLSFLIEWRHGGQVVDMAEPNRFRNGISGWTGDVRNRNIVFNGVDAQGNPNTQPILWAGTAINNTYRLFRINSSYISHYSVAVQDASWVRLRNASLSYSLPKSLFGEGSFIQGLRFTLTGNNLWLNTPFRGFDPDGLSFGSGANTFGFVGRNTPATRNYALTVSVTF